MSMIIRRRGDCHHPQWCDARLDGEHSAECPTRLELTPASVSAFCALHVTLETYVAGGRVVEIIRGKYEGLEASASIDRGAAADDITHPATARRWMAEHLTKLARERSRR